VGVEAGDEVSSFYDPMLGKLIAWGPSRELAIDRLERALAQTEITGVVTNRALLKSILRDAEFRSSGVGTNFLSLRGPQLSFAEPNPQPLDFAFAALWLATSRTGCSALWEDTRGWRVSAPSVSHWTLDAEVAAVEVLAAAEYRVRVGAAEIGARLLMRDAHEMRLEVEGRVQHARLHAQGAMLHLFRDGRQVVLKLRSSDDALQAADTAEQGSLLTPLPGTIVAVHVSEGQHVARGAPLVTVEAMKMEHTLTAPYEGVVSRIEFGVSERVAAGAVLVELSAGETPLARPVSP
jgi:3-methylcrotonyl-CoA carboxylase alpha subunit